MSTRTRYIVENKGIREGFTKSGIEALKSLDAVNFRGTARFARDGVTMVVHTYTIKHGSFR